MGDSILIEAILSVIIFFTVGLIAGMILRRAAELIILTVLLLAILSITGLAAVSPPDVIREALPWLVEAGKLILSILPYASIAFIAGLIVGLLRK